MRILKLTIALILLVQTLSGQQDQIIDKVIATVGGEYVLYSELIEAYQYQKEQNPSIDPSSFCALLEQLMAERILVNQAKLDSIEVAPSELDGQLDYRINNILRMMNGDEERFVEYYGKSVIAVKDEMRDVLRQQLLAQKIQQSLIQTVTITPKEVVAFYESIPADSMPYFNAEVELGEIVMIPKVNPEEANKAKTLLADIRAKIESGEATFEDLAKKHSMDGSAQSGGDLGWQKRGTFVPEFEAVAYSLTQGEMSDIVETEFGYHIIRLKERRGNTINVQHILISPEITQADLDATATRLDSVRNLIALDSITFERAVRIYSDKKSPSYNNGGRMVNPKTGDTFFETGDLPPQIYFEMEELELNGLSDPIETASERSTYFRMIRVQSRTKPHRASLEQDYSRIKQIAKESKKSEYYNNWMKEKIQITFIEVDPSFEDCPNIQELMLKSGAKG